MKIKSSVKNFREKLVSLRKSKGLTQDELGNKIGVSRRVIAYYEGQAKFPPTHLLIPISKALKVTSDELLGLKNSGKIDPNEANLWRRLKKAKQLSEKNRKKLFDFLDLLLRQK